MIFNCYFFKKHSIYADNRTFYKKFRLKFIYSSTSRVKVGIVNKSRNKVALKEIKSNDIQKIKVPKKDTYSIYIQNNSGKKITVSGVIIIL